MPNTEGYVGILCSDYWCEDKSETDAFMSEGHDIARELAMVGIESHLIPRYTVQQAVDVIRDPEAFSIITIGNGNLSTAYAHNREKLTWQHISDATTHLKTGRFVQRHCGHVVRNFPVPLGTFALSSHANVYAAYNIALPTVMGLEDEDYIQAVHTHRRLGFAALMSDLPFIRTTKEDDDD